MPDNILAVRQNQFDSFIILIPLIISVQDLYNIYGRYMVLFLSYAIFPKFLSTYHQPHVTLYIYSSILALMPLEVREVQSPKCIV
jgi:hypothetical protein